MRPIRLPLLALLGAVGCGLPSGGASGAPSPLGTLPPDTPSADTAASTVPLPTTSTTPAQPAACDGIVPESPYDLVLVHEGVERTAIIDLPADYDGLRQVPLVLNFHGAGTTAAAHRLYTGMHTQATARGWATVHPDGTNRTWDYLADSRDVRFVTSLLTALDEVLCIDPERVYAAGLSNGGYFSYQLACDHGDRIAAIAAVAAGDVTLGCEPGVPVPLLHFHGTADWIVPYDGNLVLPSARASVSGWARKVNACDTEPELAFAVGDVTCERWQCDPSADASLCTLDGGGHTWPGATPIPTLGPTNQDIDATSEILDFFERWRR